MFDRPESLQSQPYLEVFGPVHCVCAPLRAAISSAQWWICCEMVRECGAEIYRFLAHYCSSCITVSSSPALSSTVAKEAELELELALASLHTDVKYFNAWLAVAHSWAQTVMFHLGKVVQRRSGDRQLCIQIQNVNKKTWLTVLLAMWGRGTGLNCSIKVS